MESFVEALKGIQGVVWGPITILLLLFTGLYYTIRLKGIQIFHLHKSFQYIFEKEEGKAMFLRWVLCVQHWLQPLVPVVL